MHEITDMDTYYELLADRRAARIYEKTRARHHDPRSGSSRAAVPGDVLLQWGRARPETAALAVA